MLNGKVCYSSNHSEIHYYLHQIHFLMHGQKFANEDHLSIHKKRHVSLAIASSSWCKTPTFIADETPTPTRFIRNCEEVGLFQDLVNPFDEQFRRASEVVQIPSSAVADDVLHTPHVFPIETEAEAPPPARVAPHKSSSVSKSYLMPTLSTSECLTFPFPLPAPSPRITVTESENTQRKEKYRKLLVQPNVKTPLPQLNNAGINVMPCPAGDPLQLLFRLPDGRLVQIPTMPVATEKGQSVECEELSKSKPALSETKEKLKQVLSKAKCVPNLGPNFCVTSSVLDESKTMTNESAGTTRMDLSRLKPINRRRSFTSSSEPDQDEGEGEKRRKFLERNRYLDYRNEHPTVILITKLFEKSCGFPFASEKKMLGVEFGSENHVDEQCQQVAAE